MPLSQADMYFDGTRGWFGPGGPKSFQVSKLIAVDNRSLMTALASRLGLRAFMRVVFIDWSGGSYEGPGAGRRFGGYVAPMSEAAMWTERHRAALDHGAHDAYNEIHRRGYPTVTLEVPVGADHLWE